MKVKLKYVQKNIQETVKRKAVARASDTEASPTVGIADFLSWCLQLFLLR